MEDLIKGELDWHNKVNENFHEVASQMADIVNNNIYAAQYYTTDWGDAINKCLDKIVEIGKDAKIILPSGNLNFSITIDFTKIPQNNHYKVFLESSSYTHLQYEGSETGINMVGIDSTESYNRLSNIILKNLEIVKYSQDHIGIGIDLQQFGYIQFYNVRVVGFDKGLQMKNGSEFSGYDIDLEGNNINLNIIQDSESINDDMANVNFYNLISANQYQAGTQIDGCRIINFYGGVIADGHKIYPSLVFKSTSDKRRIEQINFTGVTLEASIENVIKIGTKDDVLGIKMINFNNCHFYTPGSIMDVCNVDTLNITNPMLQQPPSAPLVNIENGAKGFLRIDIDKPQLPQQYAIIDNRDSFFTNKNFNKFTKIFKNNYMENGISDFIERHSGQASIDTGNFLFGDQSIKVPKLNESDWNELIFYPKKNNSNFEIPAGTTILIDAIVKLDTDSIAPDGLFHLLLDNSTLEENINYGQPGEGTNRSYIVQKFTNNFYRIQCGITLTKSLSGLKFTNQSAKTNDIWLNYLAVYINDKLNLDYEN